MHIQTDIISQFELESFNVFCYYCRVYKLDYFIELLSLYNTLGFFGVFFFFLNQDFLPFQ